MKSIDDSEKGTILIVEDERIVAKDLRRTLQSFGYDVPDAVVSGEAAIRMAGVHLPDLVLLDIRIKGELDGVETARALRSRFHHLAIVFLTAHADDDTVCRAKEIGPAGYLLKPIRAEELRSTVAIALHRQEMNRLLREREKLLRVVVDSVAEGVVVADENGKLLLFNRMAERIIGMGMTDAPPAEWSSTYGAFDVDKVTPFPADQLPLARAIRGEACDRVELFIRNAGVPDGVFISLTGRPLLDERNRLKGGVVTFTDVTELREAHAKLSELASTDGLTGIPNHRAFQQRLALHIESERRFALAMCDVDHFKEVNDLHGHLVGDEVLVAVARTIQSDTRTSDFVARLGGEEFCIIYDDVDEPLAVTLAEKMRTRIGSLDTPVPITASFGVCEFSAEFRNDSTALVRAADNALYCAKRNGRNRVAGFHQL